MAAPTNAANVKKALANPEPSTHGPLRWSRFTGQFGGKAKMDFKFDYAASFSSFSCVA